MAEGRPKLPWKSILLPSEHGSWSFALEPPLLGLCLAPSWKGLAVVGAALFGFLAYRPLKLGARDLLARRRYSRTAPAMIAGTIFGLASLLLACYASWGHGWRYLCLFGVSALLAGVFAVVDARSKTGSLARELVGALITVPLVLAAFRPGVIPPALLDHRSVGAGFDDWRIMPSDAICAGMVLLILAKAVSTILYVRSRLRNMAARSGSPAKDGGNLRWAAGWAALAAAALFGAGVFTQVALWDWPIPLLPITVGVLAARALLGISRISLTIKPLFLGLQEFGYSLFFLLTVSGGYQSFAHVEIHWR